jgi:hypothetical protein
LCEQEVLIFPADRIATASHQIENYDYRVETPPLLRSSPLTTSQRGSHRPD